MQSPLVTTVLFVGLFVVASVLTVLGAFRIRSRGGSEPITGKDVAWIGIPLVAALMSAAIAGQAYRAMRPAAPEGEHGATAPAHPAATEVPAPGQGMVAGEGTTTGEATATGEGTATPEATAEAPAEATASDVVRSVEVLQETATMAPAAAAQGKTIYDTRCASCHQATGLGLPGTFPPIAGAEIPNGPADEHVKIVLNGQTGPITVKGVQYNGSMPAWKDTLTAEQIAAVITYERTAFGNKGGAVTVEQVKKLGGR